MEQDPKYILQFSERHTGFWSDGAETFPHTREGLEAALSKVDDARREASRTFSFFSARISSSRDGVICVIDE